MAIKAKTIKKTILVVALLMLLLSGLMAPLMILIK
jgi:hypothetical protein